MVVMLLVGTQRMVAQTFEYPDNPEENFRVAMNFRGTRPTISDFTTAFLNYSKENAFYAKVLEDWTRYQQKKPLSKNVTITVDTKNGYMRYDTYNPETTDTIFMEVCFWNCADGKQKLVCANTVWILNGDYGWDEYTGARFFVYDNAKKEMRTIDPEDIGALYDGDGLSVFFLPRKGKNIRVSAAGAGDRWEEVLEWDGFQFNARMK